jgi:hypothetical protein
MSLSHSGPAIGWACFVTAMTERDVETRPMGEEKYLAEQF